jgi:hypothetical protein
MPDLHKRGLFRAGSSGRLLSEASLPFITRVSRNLVSAVIGPSMSCLLSLILSRNSVAPGGFDSTKKISSGDLPMRITVKVPVYVKVNRDCPGFFGCAVLAAASGWGADGIWRPSVVYLDGRAARSPTSLSRYRLYPPERMVSRRR